ncbi:thioredoxin [archaeon CG_4_10_14_0_2_um_filter_Archaea_38_6]|nr:MAG: thioredoxin [archaeon CG07_land_8_20_14_0_80_38_8]PIU89478.1 MAG: thioredoxin [archaeon CG06_land_8_20_14_3_00_37_11]PIX43832.1 MAG: thioredoxin [archaeon CG_4_8_14_3_um_filter_38_5]PJA22134.1 MAG: thioredoxin [archaeon CG_4_10_14_0_2_um_filter_Archaea_38_6]
MADVNDDNFKEEVTEKSEEMPVLVDFWAPWCPPCLMLAPVLEEAVEEFKNKLLLIKANTNECRITSNEYKVSAIPNVKLFKNGKVISEFLGFKTKEQIIKWLKEKL